MASLDRSIAQRVRDALRLFADTDRGDITAMHAGSLRLRIGDYRCLLATTTEAVTVLRVRHRREAYR